ncbi:MAG: DNA glycosylase [Candidatus Nitrosocaldus sp.]
MNIIDVEYTLGSGQVFLWYKRGRSYYLIYSENVVRIEPCYEQLVYESRPVHIDVERLFRLDDDIHAINHSIRYKDALIGDAVNRFKGLRLMRQDPFQCLISFICATNTSITRVRYMLEGICKRFGNKVELDGLTFHTFPSPKALQYASINDLVECGLGYRARFVKGAIYSYLDMDVESLLYGSYDEVRDILVSIDGVGNKVADCVMLFSLEKLEAFPIDVWIWRVIAEYYRHLVCMDGDKRRRVSPNMYRRVSSMMRGYFGRYAGYAQQYLYCYARTYMPSAYNKDRYIHGGGD